MFITKVTAKEKSFAGNIQRDELLQCWNLENFLKKSSALYY